VSRFEALDRLAATTAGVDRPESFTCGRAPLEGPHPSRPFNVSGPPRGGPRLTWGYEWRARQCCGSRHRHGVSQVIGNIGWFETRGVEGLAGHYRGVGGRGVLRRRSRAGTGCRRAG
jgi:hypothetical protein